MVATLALAFAGGLVSCASTCFLPLIPAYITYMGGRAVALPDQTALRQQLRVLGNALLFIAGFATVFVAFGAAAGLIGADLIAYRPLLLRVAGVALVVMGVVLLGGLPWLLRQFRVEVAHRLPRGPWASYVVGLAFAIGWTPCIGPILTAILILAASSATAPKGALLLAAYSAGMGLPLLVAAGLVGQLTRLIRKAYAVTRVVNAVAAVVMIAMGALIFTNQLTILNSYLPYFAVTPSFENAFQASAAQDKPGIPRSGGPIRAGAIAPDFTVTDVDGHQVTLASLRGRPVLINFWATWCTPCRDELPMIASAYQAHRGQGLAVVAIDFKENAQAVSQFWTSLHLEPAPYLDADGGVAARYGVGLTTSGLPVSVFVARDGTVRAFAPWALDPTYLDQELAKIL
jgi:cytochrome c-type biogenesis protein